MKHSIPSSPKGAESMSAGKKAALAAEKERISDLTNVLEQYEHVMVMVAESADELSMVNTVLKAALTEHEPRPEVEEALRKSAAVQNKVREASLRLAAVNRVLEDEVRDRNLLDHRFAAALEQEEAARHASFHDPLTGLPNRALFNDRLELGFAQARRHGWTLAVMFMDLDDFKIINDTYGHDIGDRVILSIARRLKDNTRGDDTVSRHGGDEFLYLLNEVRSDTNIALIAEKLIKTIETHCTVNVGGLDVSLSVKASIGIAIFPEDGATASSLIRSADSAMYSAKQGKSGYRFAERNASAIGAAANSRPDIGAVSS
jgi:diguanylate cyclase